MANSLQQGLLSFLEHHQLNHPETLLLLAYSGGLDSSVLLHLLAKERQKGLIDSVVMAVHIHHGLQSEADAWGEHCQQQALEQTVPFQLIRIQAQAETGQSPEAVAREARYAALANAMQEHANPVLLTAQHQDDQAETLMLQLMRGAGPAGLSAMPEIKTFANGKHARPLLDCSREQLEQYAREHDLHWVEDPSNADKRYDRNFIRNAVMPMLRQRWPSASKTMARSAALLGQEHDVLQDELQQYLPYVCDGRVFRGRSLHKTPQKSLTLLIKLWLERHQAQQPSQAVLSEICSLITQEADTAGEVSWGIQAERFAVRVFQGDLYLIDLEQEARWQQFDSNADRLWELSGECCLEELNIRLTRSVLDAQGICLPENTQYAHVKFAVPTSEKLYLVGRTHSKRLKHWFQENSVPPWLRSYCPLLYVGDKLVAVIAIHKL